jgi:hypothetical protein
VLGIVAMPGLLILYKILIHQYVVIDLRASLAAFQPYFPQSSTEYIRRYGNPLLVKVANVPFFLHRYLRILINIGGITSI